MYHGICVLIALVLSAYCLYRYILDLDVSSITLRKFHVSSDDIHPSISLCCKDPFSNEALMGQSQSLKQNTLMNYYNFLQGTKSYNYIYETTRELQNIDYDNVSASLNDIVTDFSLDIFSKLDELVTLSYDVNDGFLAINKNKETLNKEIVLPDFELIKYLPVRISARRAFHKCFTFDIPMIKGVTIRSVQIKINASWASSGRGQINLGRFYVFLTFPNQTMQVPRGKKIFLNQHHRLRPRCYQFTVGLGTMEVFQRRDKSNDRCNRDWRNQDQKLQNYIVEKLACNPKHWKIKSELPFCYSAKQYQAANYFDHGMYMPPCRSIELLSKETKGLDPGWRCPKNKGYLDLLFYLNEEMYKEITLVPAL